MPSLPLKLSGRAVISDAADAVLLLRRAAHSRHFAGQWEFPGGKPEPGEDFAATLLREVAEETGLAVELGAVLGVAEHALADRRIAFLFVAATPAAGSALAPAVRLSDEHSAFAWVPRVALATCDLSPPGRDFAARLAAGPA